MIPSEVLLQRFWAKVALPDENGCMLWLAALNKGYGAFSLTGSVRKEAHRLSCILAHGEPPTADHQAAHSCRNRACVAPAHLRWATRRENAADRLRDGTDARGEKCWIAKLTEVQAKEILRRAREPRGQLAREFGVSRQTVNDLIWGRTWPNLSRSWSLEDVTRRVIPPEVAAELARRYLAGGVTQQELGAEYGISQSRVSALIARVRQEAS